MNLSDLPDRDTMRAELEERWEQSQNESDEKRGNRSAAYEFIIAPILYFAIRHFIFSRWPEAKTKMGKVGSEIALLLIYIALFRFFIM